LYNLFFLLHWALRAWSFFSYRISKIFWINVSRNR